MMTVPALAAPCRSCLKPEHYAGILAARPEIGFFEIHAEN